MTTTLTTAAALKLANGNREVARGLIRAPIVAAAEVEARFAGRSLKCKRKEHSTERYGCANDGSTCICACHDATPYTEETE
jgi:hypothetical protein